VYRRPYLPTLAPLAVVTFAAAAFGCSANVGAEQDAGATQRLALVEVRVQQTPEGLAGRFDASARFVSIREPGSPNDALDLLGFGWRPVPVGVCASVEGESSAPPAAPVHVELKDLSPVALELKGDDGLSTRLGLEPRAFPDVAGLVSGVVFVAPADTALVSGPRTATVQAGSATFGGLDLPDLPSRLQLVDAIPENGTYTVAHTLDFVASSVRDGDRLAIDVVRGGVVRLRCGVDAQGKLRIELGNAGEATLVVRALRRIQREDVVLGPVDARLERDIELKLLVK
jgi:hypothetical protein